MQRTKLSIGLLVMTLIVCGRLMIHTEAPAAPARIVAVARADVHQVVAVTGVITYEEERLLYAPASGAVEQVYMEQGKAVSPGEAVVKLDTSAGESLLSAVIQGTGAAEAFHPLNSAAQQHALSNLVIRSNHQAVIRQLFVQPDDLVYAGMPVARMTSNRQIIQCTVVKADAHKVRPGMWAWLKENQKTVGVALVETVEDVPADASDGLPLCMIRLRPEQYMEKPEGAIVDAEIYLAGSDDVLSLPLEAVTSRGTVWQVMEGRCLELPADVILCDEINAWVNLPEGMQVAIGEFVAGQRVTEAKP